MREGVPNSRKERFEAAKGVLSYEERRAIGSMATQLGPVLKQLESELRSGAYKMVVGDDVSGRLPAIAVTEAMRAIYKAHGHEAPLLRFVAGGKRNSMIEWVDGQIKRETEMLERAGQMKEELGEAERVLIVTEAVSTGENMKLLVKSLRQAGLAPDIASMSFLGERYTGTTGPVSHEEVEKKLQSRVIFGSNRVPDLYGTGMQHLHGVEKRPGSATAERFVPPRDSSQEEDDPERVLVQMKVNAARILAMRVGEDLSKEFLRTEDE